MKVYAVNGPAAARPEKVSCGTPFSETKWSNDDACEGPLSGQAGVIFMAFGLGVVCFVLGAGVLAFSMNRQLQHPPPQTDQATTAGSLK